MSKILAYMPTYSPVVESNYQYCRPYERSGIKEVRARLANPRGRIKPWMYMDAIDSFIYQQPEALLVVGDGRSTETIRKDLQLHQEYSRARYTLELYPEKMSQWAIFNDIFRRYATEETEYFVYFSSDIISVMDWVGAALKEFEKDPKLQILFPAVSCGDKNLKCQIQPGPIDADPFEPPFQSYGRAPVLNAYAMVIRMDLLKAFGGYPTLFRNCYTESFYDAMCKAVGGTQKLAPRSWVHHWGTGDLWKENGSFYYYNEEKGLFVEAMDEVDKLAKMNDLTVQNLKRILYP